MNIDRPMASLFFQIKRSVPFEARDQMKLSSPDVGKNLISLYNRSSDKAIKLLIEDFMSRAGEEWKSQLAGSSRAKLVNAIRRKLHH